MRYEFVKDEFPDGPSTGDNVDVAIVVCAVSHMTFMVDYEVLGIVRVARAKFSVLAWINLLGQSRSGAKKMLR